MMSQVNGIDLLHSFPLLASSVRGICVYACTYTWKQCVGRYSSCNPMDTLSSLFPIPSGVGGDDNWAIRYVGMHLHY